MAEPTQRLKKYNPANKFDDLIIAGTCATGANGYMLEVHNNFHSLNVIESASA